eukprot:679825-Pyramimonas_sp.AAC.1
MAKAHPGSTPVLHEPASKKKQPSQESLLTLIYILTAKTMSCPGKPCARPAAIRSAQEILSKHFSMSTML